MKILAFYLPQFHRIKENDLWWGEGFTEWTNVKKALPLYKGHRQPRIPLNENYYDLLDVSTRRWQAELAKKYGIFGFCYYHYWFNGKLLLEKPIEMMLKDGEPNLPFCLSWANEPWTRTWDGKDHHILMNQIYASEKDWENHFNYLLKFFKNKNYVKVDNKPLFLIYRLDRISNYKSMVSFWNELAYKNGFEGVHISQTMNGFYDEFLNGVDSRVILEPMNTESFHMPLVSVRALIPRGGKTLLRTFYKDSQKVPKLFLNRIDYDYVWNRIIERKIRNSDVPIFPGAFTDWDNTPRSSSDGAFFIGSTPEKFHFYLSKLINKTKTEYKTDMIFLNAWNEWAEGAYLEPDTDNGFGYLESIKRALELDSK